MFLRVNSEPAVEFPAGSRCSDVCATIVKNMSSVVAAQVNGETKDLSFPLKEGDEVRPLTFEDPEGQYVFWHSSAHLLAQAILRLHPTAKPTIGPPIEHGFYYDFARLNISENDFPAIEVEMQNIVKERFPIERIHYANKEQALKQFDDNSFKTELIEEFNEGLSAYKQGEFVDLCRGAHVPHVGYIKAFKILKTSGAYWRANTENEQLTRIYAISFPDKKQLKDYLRFLEEAEKRNHRVLGKKHHLFSFHTEAPGMAFFHPKGMTVWDELLRFWSECHVESDYKPIKTPSLLHKELWVKSGHWENYRENMYTAEIDNTEFALKPMNCPGCLLFYKSGQYSYRQFPLRISEIGNVHRHELSGALSGLFRVRSFHQDDAHIFMTEEQIRDEVAGIIDLADRVYSQFGLEYYLELSTRPKKSIGTEEQWEVATHGLREALEHKKCDFTINEGDGAFYGPKIDLHIKDAIGRTWQCGTIQLDLNLPERFDIYYDDRDGGKQRPVMLHRTIFGSIERFFGILTEHFTARFPLWLSPEQVRVLSIADRHQDYAQETLKALRQAGFRAESDFNTQSVSKKVRQAQMDQVNYILVIGDQEVEEKSINVRSRNNERLGSMNVENFIVALQKEYSGRLTNSAFNL